MRSGLLAADAVPAVVEAADGLANPDVEDLVGDGVLRSVDGFESGSTVAWSSTTP